MTLRDRTGPRRLAALTLLALASMGAKVETWKQESASAFGKGQRERVIVSDLGRVRLSQEVRDTARLDAARVWDLARTPAGVVYAATGDAGKVFRREAGDKPWVEAFDAEDTQALALATLPDGRVFLGTGPSGMVVDLTDPKHPATRPDPKVQYIWDLAADLKGNLYAATGPTGQLWKRSASDGAWSLLLDGKNPHLLSVAIGPDGSAYAGSDGEGLIYRVTPDGKTSVVYDAPQSEIRTLHLGPDGALYAGTAGEAGGSGGPARSPGLFGAGGGLPRPGGPEGMIAAAQIPPRPDDAPSRREGGPAANPAGGTALPKPTAAGENVVYRIAADGIPREIFRAKALIHALAFRDERLYIGTGPEGQLYEVRDLGRESAPVARLDHGQILALLADPKDGLLIGAGDPGGVLRLEPGFAKAGTLTSDILDAKLLSRFGAVTWKSDTPAGTSISVRVRTGNVGEPDTTWSDWSPARDDPAMASAGVPPGRFAQYQVNLATTDPARSPELRSVSVRYQTTNLPPEITKLDVPDVAAGDGATRPAKMTVRWDATDPNGDDLAYTLAIRKEGWPDWIKLGEGPITETNYAWDTSAVPGGVFRLRLTASDRPGNNPDDALGRDRVSDSFLIDHRAPEVEILPRPRRASVTLRDDLTRIVKAAYALDGGDWVPVFPGDGLFDTAEESIAIDLPDLKPGTHVLMVRATDAAGNQGTGDLVLKAP